MLARKGEFNDFGKTGEWAAHHPNGNLKELKSFNEKGWLDGNVKTYYPNGLLKSAGTYSAGLTEPQKEWSLTDSTIGTFVPQQMPTEYQTGRWKYYSEQGLIAEEVTYNSIGLKEGKSKTYFDNGNIESAGKYKVIKEVQEEIRFSPTTYEKITVKKMVSVEKKTGRWKYYSELGNKRIVQYR